MIGERVVPMPGLAGKLPGLSRPRGKRNKKAAPPVWYVPASNTDQLIDCPAQPRRSNAALKRGVVFQPAPSARGPSRAVILVNTVFPHLGPNRILYRQRVSPQECFGDTDIAMLFKTGQILR